jgi:5'-nucleotidase
MMRIAILSSTLTLALGLAGCGDGSSGPDQPTLRILVTNDDGVGAEGIDVLVEALIADPANQVVVVAPESNRSGSGNQTGPSAVCGNLSVEPAQTRSGHPATAIDGCPADAVNYGLDMGIAEGEPFDVVVSGINEGQNVSKTIVLSLSGTVGAARAAAVRGLPALATSQGLPSPGGSWGYEANAEIVVAWIDEFRRAILEEEVGAWNLNVPSCQEGEIRGVVEAEVAGSGDGAFSTSEPDL